MSARPRRRRVLSAALALVGALALVVPVSGAAVAPTPSPSSSPDLPVTVQILEVAPSVLRPGEELRVRATLHNDGDETIERPVAALRINRFRVVSRDELDTWATAGTDGLNRSTRVTTSRVDTPLLPGASVTARSTTAACTRWCTTSCWVRRAGSSPSRATRTGRRRTRHGSPWPS